MGISSSNRSARASTTDSHHGRAWCAPPKRQTCIGAVRALTLFPRPSAAARPGAAPPLSDACMPYNLRLRRAPRCTVPKRQRHRARSPTSPTPSPPLPTPPPTHFSPPPFPLLLLRRPQCLRLRRRRRLHHPCHCCHHFPCHRHRHLHHCKGHLQRSTGSCGFVSMDAGKACTLRRGWWDAGLGSGWDPMSVLPLH